MGVLTAPSERMARAPRAQNLDAWKCHLASLVLTVKFRGGGGQAKKLCKFLLNHFFIMRKGAVSRVSLRITVKCVIDRLVFSFFFYEIATSDKRILIKAL